jgi:hypothetical protein
MIMPHQRQECDSFMIGLLKSPAISAWKIYLEDIFGMVYIGIAWHKMMPVNIYKPKHNYGEVYSHDY